jgi:hypothetical protein
MADDYLDYWFEALSRAVRTTLFKWGMAVNIFLALVTVVYLSVAKQPDVDAAKNALIIIGISTVLFFIPLIVYELRSAFCILRISPEIKKDIEHGHDIAILNVMSDEAGHLSLSAKLIKADLLFSMGSVLYPHPQKLDILEWLSQNQDEEKDCEAKIKPLDGREVSVAQYNNGIVFTYCHGARKIIGHGIVLVKIRIDGSNNGRAIFPKYFTGYLYSFNVVDGKFNYAKLGFREGENWKENEEIPMFEKSQKVMQ